MSCLLTLFDLQRLGNLKLKEAGIETASLDVRVLLCHACDLDDAKLIAYPERRIEPDLAERFLDLISRRCRHVPVAHLVGSREFWGLEFFVNGETLIPRPETEFAVEQALRQIEKIGKNLHLLDLGCGTGCLLISLLNEVPHATGLGVDINPGAVELAQRNAVANGVDARAQFLCANWAEGLSGPFDLIVSNPPYVTSGDLLGLMPDVAVHEPARALDGGADGLDEYRKIIPQAAGLLVSKGGLVLEIGDGQAADVLALLDENGFVAVDVEAPVIFDLAGRERVLSMVRVC